MSRVRRPGFASSLLAGLTVLGAACGGRGDGVMVTEPPPPGYEEGIASEREAKDERFRTDEDTPLLAEDLPGFEGLEYWPVDPDYRLVGPIHRYAEPQQFTILSTSGKPRPCERYGWMDFRLKGRTLRLHVYRLLDTGERAGVDSFFLPFTDATTGKETYPAGRYIDLREEGRNRYVLDFNRTYNPLCAYGAPERYVCPVTPPENRLPVRIEAGEWGYKRHGIPE
jgi:uncharacterized protein (DUF1684 family)